MQNVKTFLTNVTHQPGVYQMLNAKGEVIYVGKARDLKKRLSSYFSAKAKDIKTLALIKHVENIDITVTHNEREALLLEWNLIRKHKPHYNVVFRDDKSYPYILITDDHPFPRIDFYRGNRKRGGLFFGPFPNATAVRETIQLIQRIFQLRTCSDSFYAARQRPCLQHQIGRCTSPCVGLISAEDYQQNVQHAVLFLQGKNQQILAELTQRMEQAAQQLNYELAAKLRDQITKLREIQARQYVSSEHGDADVIGLAASAGVSCIQLLMIRGGRILGSRAYFPNAPLHADQEEVLASFLTQHYFNITHELPKEIILPAAISDQAGLEIILSEQAQHKVTLATHVRSERKKWLEIANASAEHSLASQLLNKTNAAERLRALQELLQLKKLPQSVECFDISHSMGEATVGSCVVFNKLGPVKSDYRRFNITDITPGDDIAAMRQALLRRYKRLQAEEAKLPDVLLIDGGIPQLNAAKNVLAELDIHTILLVGVAKGVTRKPGFETLHFTDRAPVHLSPDSLALHFIQQIRDEAHRFAITAHRARRDKKRVTSVLEGISGIGAKRRRELLRYFGGIQAINRASLEEIAKVPGISQALAERIYSALHNV